MGFKARLEKVPQGRLTLAQDASPHFSPVVSFSWLMWFAGCCGVFCGQDFGCGAVFVAELPVGLSFWSGSAHAGGKRGQQHVGEG